MGNNRSKSKVRNGKGEDGKDDSSKPTVSESQIGSNFLNPRGERVDIHGVQIGCSHHIQAEPGAKVIIDQTGKAQKTNPSGTPEDCALIRTKLKEWYKDIKLPVVPWMKKGSTNLLIGHCFIKLQLNSTSRAEGSHIELQNIFDDVEGTAPTRILIDSQPGFGKTTLAHKIISDWVNGDDYVRHFNFAVLVTLGSLRNKSVEDAVSEITKLDCREDLNSWKVINNDKTLLVLDGLDEVGDENRENILKILYDTFNNKMVIVVTCRTGLFKLDEESVDFVFGGAAKGDKFWQKKITILGITNENRGEFLDKFIQVENKDQIIERIEKIIEPVNEMFKSPLLLILLVFVTLNDQNVEIKNKTDLFKNLINCIIRRSASKIRVNLKSNFTIFDVSSDNDYFNLFYKFGKFTKDHIMNNDLQFECNDDTDSIYQMGFFIRHETQQIFGAVAHYEVFHLSVLEFVTAFFMWREFLKNGKQLPNELLRDVNEICRKKGSTSLVLPFLFGLIGKDVKLVFNQLSQYYSMYSVNSSLMDIIFSECELSDDMNDVISKFVPLSLNASDSSSVFTNNAVLNKILVKLVVRSSDLRFLTQSLNVKIFELILNGWRYAENLDHIVNNIKCEHLILANECSYVNYENMAKYLKMFVAMSTEYRHIRVSGLAIFGVVLECVNAGILAATVIDFLCCELPIDHIVAETFASVLARAKVKHLSINVCWSSRHSDIVNYLNTIISTVAKSTTVNSIYLLNSTGSDTHLDLNSIVPIRGKTWELIKLEKFRVTQCEESLFRRDCIDTFDITYPHDCVESNALTAERAPPVRKKACNLGLPSFTWRKIGKKQVNSPPNKTVWIQHCLREISPCSLRCPCDLLNAVIRKPNSYSWYGWDSIAEITLIFDSCDLFSVAHFAKSCVFGCVLNFDHLRRFKRLKVVNICLSSDVTLVNKFSVSSLKELNVDKVQIQWMGEFGDEFCSLICGIEDLIRTDELPKSIKNIDLVLCDTCKRGYDVFHMNILLSILDYSSKIRARFVFEDTNAISVFFEKVFIDFSKFSVESEISDHCKPYKSYDYFGAFSTYYYELTIKKKL